MVDDAVGALGERTAISSSMILGTVSASERMAPVQGLQPSERRRQVTHCSSPGRPWMKGCSRGMRVSLRTSIRRSLGEVERDDGDFFEMDVVPDVELGPVGERENADAFAWADARR